MYNSDSEIEKYEELAYSKIKASKKYKKIYSTKHIRIQQSKIKKSVLILLSYKKMNFK